jgi:hypothetical protein
MMTMTMTMKRMMSLEEIIQVLNELPKARHMAPLVDKLENEASRHQEGLGDYLFKTFAGVQTAPTSEATPRQRIELPEITAPDEPLRRELKAMYDSGCPFDDTDSPRMMRVFCSDAGLLYNVTPNQISSVSLKRKLNVCRTSFEKWATKQNSDAA